MDSVLKPNKPLATLSIVSHGHGEMIDHLLDDIAHGADLPCEIVLTINIPEDEAFLAKHESLNIRIIRNNAPKGFGANHNQAFKEGTAPYFVIVNPDIRANPFELKPLIEALEDPLVGAVGPKIVDEVGRIQDNARKFPTLWNMLKRKFGSRSLDYLPNNRNIEVDWVAGMLVAFSRKSYHAVNGFDTKYFMYVEDADICWKLGQINYKVLLISKISFIHAAQRASHKKIQHLNWHLRGLARFNLKSLGLLT